MVDPLNNVRIRPDPITPRAQGDAGRRTAAAPPLAGNPRLLAAMQAGRETSALISELPGPNMSFFQPPAPPAAPAGAPLAGTQQAGAGPRLSAPLLETVQEGRTNAVLLSGLMGAGRGGALPPASPFSWAARGQAPGAAAAMRTAQEIMQDVGSLPPSPDTRRIANEAYVMESRAQRDLQSQRAAGLPGAHEWFA